MGIEYIKQLAFEFRKALEYIVDNKLYGRLNIFAHFPKECCGYTTDLLATYLIKNGISRERIQRLNGITKKEDFTHCWLMLDEYLYIDITADQFNDRLYFKQITPIPPCYIIEKGLGLYEYFDSKRMEYSYNFGIDTYSGDVASKLETIYKVAIRQIRKHTMEE
mgnify:CR=1 FL=1